MKISISQCKEALVRFFQSHHYSEEVSYIMATALIRSELFQKKTHGISRAKWIITKNISKNTESTSIKVHNNITIMDCLWNNGYACAQQAVRESRAIHNNEDFHIFVLKNIFPTNALIDYLWQFHARNLWAIIITTTPYLVWMRGSWEKFLWTNPIWYTFPNDIGNIIADMSTSNSTFWELLNNYQSIQEKIVLNQYGEKDFPKNVFHNSIFSWALLPFWWEKWEHKWFIISLFIELLTAALAGNRSDNGDMIIFSFSPSWNLYQKHGINQILQKMSSNKNVRIPWEKSYHYYQESIKNNFIEINEKDFQILKNFF